jgi:hypothetical protein
VAAAATAITIQAQSISDGNSSLAWTANPGQSTSWLVDSLNQFGNLSYFYRVGSSGPEYNLASLTPSPTVTYAYGVNGRQMTLTYGSAQLEIKVGYTLTGGSAGSGTASKKLITIPSVKKTARYFFRMSFVIFIPLRNLLLNINF